MDRSMHGEAFRCNRSESMTGQQALQKAERSTEIRQPGEFGSAGGRAVCCANRPSLASTVPLKFARSATVTLGKLGMEFLTVRLSPVFVICCNRRPFYRRNRRLAIPPFPYGFGLTRLAIRPKIPPRPGAGPHQEYTSAKRL